MLASDLPVCFADKNGEHWECCQIAPEGRENTREEKKNMYCVEGNSSIPSFVWFRIIDTKCLSPQKNVDLAHTKMLCTAYNVSYKPEPMVHCQKL